MTPKAGILILAHAPLASALRQVVLHVFPDADVHLAALDVQPNTSPEESLSSARIAMQQLGCERVLVLADAFGATPCNVAAQLVDGVQSRLVAGVNLPMLLRTVTYRHESLDALVQRALSGATQGILSVAATAPQNQTRKPQLAHHDQHHHHQQ